MHTVEFYIALAAAVAYAIRSFYELVTMTNFLRDWAAPALTMGVVILVSMVFSFVLSMAANVCWCGRQVVTSISRCRHVWNAKRNAVAVAAGRARFSHVMPPELWSLVVEYANECDWTPPFHVTPTDLWYALGTERDPHPDDVVRATMRNDEESFPPFEHFRLICEYAATPLF